MTHAQRTVRTVRIDVPLRTTMCAYLYFDSDTRNRWHPWWGALYDYVLGLAPSEMAWRHEPIQNVDLARPQLSDEQRADLLRFLRTAPDDEVREHRTLRRAVDLSDEQVPRLDVMFFSAPVHQQPRRQ